MAQNTSAALTGAMSLSDIYMIVCYVGIALCILFLIITLVLFFKDNIIEVIGDLSGSNARKGIENIRNQNRSSGNKAHKPSHVNLERGRLTDKITKSGALIPAGESVGVSVGTEKFQTGKLVTDETTLLDVQETEVLIAEEGQSVDETTILVGNDFGATTVLDASTNETTVLSYGSEETTVLNMAGFETFRTGVVVEDEIIFVHSNEYIN